MSAQNLETLAKRYVELKSRIADLQEEADGLKAELMEDREPGEYAAGPLTVKIRKGKRNLDARAFERRFPVQQYADCYRIQPKALSEIVSQVGEPAFARVREDRCGKSGGRMTRVPISQEAVGRALSKTLDHYDKAPGFMDEAYIIDTQEAGDLAAFLWARLDEECGRVGYELATRP